VVHVYRVNGDNISETKEIDTPYLPAGLAYGHTERRQDLRRKQPRRSGIGRRQPARIPGEGHRSGDEQGHQ
jgi:hypothetical protein